MAFKQIPIRGPLRAELANLPLGQGAMITSLSSIMFVLMMHLEPEEGNECANKLRQIAMLYALGPDLPRFVEDGATLECFRIDPTKLASEPEMMAKLEKVDEYMKICTMQLLEASLDLAGNRG